VRSGGLARVSTRTVGNASHAAHFVGSSRAAAQIRIVVSFTPKDPRLLDLLAAQSAHQPGLPIATIRRLVSPPRTLISEMTSYLHGYGFSPTKSGILTETYAGTIQAADHAFHTQLGIYKSGHVVFRSPATAPRLPNALARHVQTITGLDTYPTHDALGTHSHVAPFTSLTSCPGAVNVQALFGVGYTAQQFASASAYDIQPLIDASDDGRGGVIDMIEYSTYNGADNTDYENCYGVSTPIGAINVAGGTNDESGLAEVELDDQIATTGATGLDHIYNYEAPQSANEGQVIDQMLTDAAITHVTEISTSWGTCEPLADPGDIAATHAELELAAIAGIPVFAASGDDGSQACRTNHIAGPAVTFPASDPYATAVGGTTLNISTAGADHETAWGTPTTPDGGGGGGGVSNFFPIPSWQTGTGVIEPGFSSMNACGQVARYCRELPDVSLDANVDTGYIFNCTINCGTGIGGWQPIGGTSAAAPLLAAIIADADTYSLAHSGTRLGYANPFFYSEAGTSMFNDITVGTNGTTAYAGYPAGAGYDMATGLGSVDANTLAADLAAWTNPAISIDTTTLTAGSSRKSITPRKVAVLSGTLTDTTTGLPLGDRPIAIEGVFAYAGHIHLWNRHLLTDANGDWSVNASTKTIASRMLWQVAYPGAEGITSALTRIHTLYVVPKLGMTTPLRRSRDHTYHVAHNTNFTLRGSSNPNLRGFKVTLQFKVRGTRRWRSTGLQARVGRRGSWAMRLRDSKAQRVSLRWHFTGSVRGEYLSANSNSLPFTIT
jgi:hypothetical protein